MEFPADAVVTLGLDPRGLHLTDARQVKSPRVKPEGDDLWVDEMWGALSFTNYLSYRPFSRNPS
jgi:hypothetical protein